MCFFGDVVVARRLVRRGFADMFQHSRPTPVHLAMSGPRRVNAVAAEKLESALFRFDAPHVFREGYGEDLGALAGTDKRCAVRYAHVRGGIG